MTTENASQEAIDNRNAYKAAGRRQTIQINADHADTINDAITETLRDCRYGRVCLRLEADITGVDAELDQVVSEAECECSDGYFLVSVCVTTRTVDGRTIASIDLDGDCEE